MKFQKIEVEFEKYESLDIIATSFGAQDPTTQVPTTEPEQGTDPYEKDKW